MKNAILKISSVRGLFFVLLSIAIVFAACSKLLVEDPKDQVFIDNFFETENDAISAVNSIYAILNSTSTAPTFGGVYHSSYFIVQGLTSDEMENRLVGATDLNEMDQFKHKPVNATARDFWSNAYKAIGNANFALEGIPKVPMNET
ncbi:MAG: hypothetical protein ABIV51_08135, partial [Saprospiraceae bacterium]